MRVRLRRLALLRLVRVRIVDSGGAWCSAEKLCGGGSGGGGDGDGGGRGDGRGQGGRRAQMAANSPPKLKARCLEEWGRGIQLLTYAGTAVTASLSLDF